MAPLVISVSVTFVTARPKRPVSDPIVACNNTPRSARAIATPWIGDDRWIPLGVRENWGEAGDLDFIQDLIGKGRPAGHRHFDEDCFRASKSQWNAVAKMFGCVRSQQDLIARQQFNAVFAGNWRNVIKCVLHELCIGWLGNIGDMRRRDEG